MSQHSQQHRDYQQPASDYQGGPEILPHRVRPDMTVTELIEQQFQAYNAARLHEAARLYVEKMLDPAQDTTIALTLAGALTPAGLGGCIITLMEYGFIDFIISTGANLYHDMHYALAMTTLSRSQPMPHTGAASRAPHLLRLFPGAKSNQVNSKTHP